MITEEQRNKARAELPQEIEELYSSKMSTAINKEMSEKYGLEGDKGSSFLDVTGDVILGFYKISDLPKLLQTEVGMDLENAKKLTSQLIDVWEPIVKREEAEVKAQKDEVASLADKIEAIEPTQNKEGGFRDGKDLSHEEVKPIPAAVAEVDRPHGYGALPQNQDKPEDEPVIKATSQEEIRPNTF